MPSRTHKANTKLPTETSAGSPKYTMMLTKSWVSHCDHKKPVESHCAGCPERCVAQEALRLLHGVFQEVPLRPPAQHHVHTDGRDEGHPIAAQTFDEHLRECFGGEESEYQERGTDGDAKARDKQERQWGQQIPKSDFGKLGLPIGIFRKQAAEFSEGEVVAFATEHFAIAQVAHGHGEGHDAARKEPQQPPRLLLIGVEEWPQRLNGVIAHNGIGRKGETDKRKKVLVSMRHGTYQPNRIGGCGLVQIALAEEVRATLAEQSWRVEPVLQTRHGTC